MGTEDAEKKIKDFVEELKREKRGEPGYNKKDTIVEEYRLHRLALKPGKSTTDTMHLHHIKHGIVLQGTATVWVEGEKLFVPRYAGYTIPMATPYRIENSGKLPLDVLEVNVGDYVQEDDSY